MLLDLEWVSRPEREPPDKQQELHTKLQDKLKNLKETRMKVKPKDDTRKYTFDGSEWEKHGNGSWDTSPNSMEQQEARESLEIAKVEYEKWHAHYEINAVICSMEDAEWKDAKARYKSVHTSEQSDTGANVTATPHQQLLRNYVPIKLSTINTAKEHSEASSMTAIGIGQMPHISDCGRLLWINAYHIPQLNNTIKAPSAITFQFAQEFYAFAHKGNVDDLRGTIHMRSRKGEEHDLFYEIACVNGLWWHKDPHMQECEPHVIPKSSAHIAALSDAAKYELWHQRLAHLGHHTVVNAHKGVDGVPPVRGNAFYRCPSCMSAKATKRPTHEYNPLGGKAPRKKLSIPADTKQSTCTPCTTPHDQPGTTDPVTTPTDHLRDATNEEYEAMDSFLDELHMPEAEPGQHFHIDHGFVRGSEFKDVNAAGNTITSIDGKRSYCLIVDRASRYMWIYTAPTKDPPINAVKAVLQKFKSTHSHRTVRTDQDKTLGKSHAFRNMVENEGFLLELTGLDASVQNSRAERPHRDLGNMMRCLLHGADLSSKYWSFAIMHAAYVKNRVPHAGLGMSPYKKLTGRRPNLAHLRVFGSIVYAKDPGKRKAKLDHHTSRGIFLGFSATTGNVHYQDLKSGNFKIGTHVYFDEAHMTSAAGKAPIAAEALQRLGYHVRESWIDLEVRSSQRADVQNHMLMQKLTTTAITPDRSTETSIGYDLYSDVNDVTIQPGRIGLISTGIALRAPSGTYLRVAPRSGLTIKRKLDTRAGVVDPDYTGAIIVVVHNFGDTPQTIQRGDRIAQLLVEKAATPVIKEVDELPNTARNAHGFGSTEAQMQASPSRTPPPNPTSSEQEDIIHALQLEIEMEMPYDIYCSSDPFENKTFREFDIKGSDPFLGMELEQCQKLARPRLKAMKKGTPGSRIIRWRSELRNAYVLGVGKSSTYNMKDVQQHIHDARERGDKTIKVHFATTGKQPIHPQSGLPQLYNDQLNIIAQHLWEIKHDPEWKERALGNIPILENMLTDPLFQAMMKKDKTISRLFIQTLKKKTLKQQRKLTRRILKKLDTWNEWQQSEWKQLDQYKEQETFEISERGSVPKNANKLTLLWTYLIKDDGRLKARCVCNGSKRMTGSVTLAETYASSLEQTASRVFWAATAIYNFVTIGADAANAFAEAPPPVAPLYVYADDQYREWHFARTGEKLPPNQLLRVKKALQGHPESARLWAQLIDRVIKGLNLTACTHEPNLYFTNDYNHTGKTVLFLRQVDDFAIACQDEATAEQVIADIDAKMTIKVKKLGRINRFNGVDVEQTRHYVKLYNTTYIRKILKNHPWISDKTAYPTTEFPIPMRSDSIYQQEIETAVPMDADETKAFETKYGFTYRQIIGELLFAMVTCRPDISFATIKLSQYSTKAAQVHYEAAMAVLVYLRDTENDGIYYWRKTPRTDLPFGKIPSRKREGDYEHHDITECHQHDQHILVGAKDSDFAGDTSHRRSVTGIVVKLAGGVVLASSSYQKTVAMSSTEAEFTAAALAGKSILYLRTIMEEIGLPQEQATILYEDNQGALLMANAQKPTKRTRHMCVKLFALQSWIEQDLLAIRRINTSDNYSDAMTKALGRTLFYRHNDFIMGRVIPEYTKAMLQPTIQRLCISRLCIVNEIDYISSSDPNQYLLIIR